MTLRLRLLNVFLRAFEKGHLAREPDPAKLRRSFELKARLFFRPPRGARFKALSLGGVPALDARGAGVTGDGAGVILYFHGGGYVMGSPRTHRAMMAQLSGLTGRAAILPDYRKAPEHAFPGAVEDALDCYRALSESHGAASIVIGGDSAGGGLALALLGEILRLELPRPAGVFTFSPLTDVTFSGPSFSANAQADVMLPAARARDMEQHYLAGADPRDPRASPLFAAFKGAPPVWICAGTTEILLDDTRRMAAHLREEGVQVQEVIAPGLPHVWPIFQTTLPEGRETLREVARWISSLSRSSPES